MPNCWLCNDTGVMEVDTGDTLGGVPVFMEVPCTCQDNDLSLTD